MLVIKYLQIFTSIHFRFTGSELPYSIDSRLRLAIVLCLFLRHCHENRIEYRNEKGESVIFQT